MPEITPIKLSALANSITNAITQNFVNQFYWVIADVTSYSFNQQKNHHYFDLVEKAENTNGIAAKLNAAAFSTGHGKIRDFERLTAQRFKNDIHILVKVSVEFHPQYGLKLIVHDVDPSFTLGTLELQRQATIQRLLTECADFIQKRGDVYFTRNKALTLNTVIQDIAVVTSSSSAGFQDFNHTLENNRYGYKFRIFPFFTMVQGELNAASMTQKLIDVFHSGKKYDAVIVIRGGGAQTDFRIFDQFNLCRAVAKFPIPIITGIGHQKNETIVDMLAHTVTKTPTQAAEYILSHNKHFEDSLMTLQKVVVIKTQQLFSIHSQRLSSINTTVINKSRNQINIAKDNLIRLNQKSVSASTSFLLIKHREMIAKMQQISSRPKIVLSNGLKDIENITINIKSYQRIFFINQSGYVNHFVSFFRLASPAGTLKRGFAIVKKNGVITSNPEIIHQNDSISVLLSNKEIKSIVKSKTDYNGDEFNL